MGLQRRSHPPMCVLVIAIFISSTAWLMGRAAPTPLLTSLQAGGYTLIMRHASSPREVPAPEHARADNANLERQLDAAGERAATNMGEAFRRLHIPIGRVLTSPAYRALQTVRAAGFERPEAAPELGDGGQSMHGVTGAQGAWLRARAAEAPPPKHNTLIVTHQPNLATAFPAWGTTVAEGETVIVKPDGHGSLQVVARVSIAGWTSY